MNTIERWWLQNPKNQNKVKFVAVRSGVEFSEMRIGEYVFIYYNIDDKNWNEYLPIEEARKIYIEYLNEGYSFIEEGYE